MPTSTVAVDDTIMIMPKAIQRRIWVTSCCARDNSCTELQSLWNATDMSKIRLNNRTRICLSISVEGPTAKIRRNHNKTASIRPRAITTPPATQTVAAVGVASRLLTNTSRTCGIIRPTTDAAIVTNKPKYNRRRMGLMIRHKRPMASSMNHASYELGLTDETLSCISYCPPATGMQIPLPLPDTRCVVERLFRIVD